MRWTAARADAPWLWQLRVFIGSQALAVNGATDTARLPWSAWYPVLRFAQPFVTGLVLGLDVRGAPGWCTARLVVVAVLSVAVAAFIVAAQPEREASIACSPAAVPAVLARWCQAESPPETWEAQA